MLKGKSHNVAFTISEADSSLKDVEITCVMNGEDEVNDFISSDFPSEYSTSGNESWSVDQTVTFQGEYALKSGQIFDNQVSKLKLERFTREGSLSFYTKVSSEEGSDSLLFYIDGIKKGGWSGNMDWTLVSFNINVGEHELEWRYKKDGSNAVGDDAAWIDYLVTPSADTIRLNAKTDPDGEAVFYGIDRYEKLSYHIYSDNHEEWSDTISSVDKDTTISLSLTPVYQIAFKVISDETSGSIDVSDAIIRLENINRQDTTDLFGEALFKRISINDSMHYEITKTGYLPDSGVVSVTDSNIAKHVVLELKPELQAANLISPNGDGKNDYWEIYNVERYSEFRVDIYSTTGELLYTATDYENNKWNGKTDDRELPDGIYYYIITSPQNEIVFKGVINLIN